MSLLRIKAIGVEVWTYSSVSVVWRWHMAPNPNYWVYLLYWGFRPFTMVYAHFYFNGGFSVF